MIAALFVEKDGCYYGLPGVDPWDIERDARLYAGPHPVIAHPPCARWCRLAGLVESLGGKKKRDDDGCFRSALESVRKWGGVLEHPAYSDAWDCFHLPIPKRGGWQKDAIDGGWVVEIDQSKYGHAAQKATWLYAYGVDPKPINTAITPTQIVVGLARGNRSGKVEMPKSRRHLTPIPFRDLLIEIANGAAPQPQAAPQEPVARVFYRPPERGVVVNDWSRMEDGMLLYAAPIAQTADARDAARYRWLSYQTTVRFGDGNEFIMQNDMTMEELDAAIDSVIAERHAAIATPQPTAQDKRECHWHQEDVDGDCYDTGCGHAFSMLESSDDPGAWMKFCCYCGKKAVVHPWEDDDDSAAIQREGEGK